MQFGDLRHLLQYPVTKTNWSKIWSMFARWERDGELGLEQIDYLLGRIGQDSLIRQRIPKEDLERGRPSMHWSIAGILLAQDLGRFGALREDYSGPYSLAADLMSSEHLGGLRRIVLNGHVARSEVLEALASNPALEGLRELELVGTLDRQAGGRGVLGMEEASFASSLRRLNLGGNGLRDEDIFSLFTSFASLRCLELHDHHLDEVVGLLLEEQVLPSLRYLSIDQLEELDELSTCRKLEGLQLVNCGGIDLLSEMPVCAGLRSLSLVNCHSPRSERRPAPLQTRNIASVLEAAPGLLALELRSLPDVDAPPTHHWLEEYPQLEVVIPRYRAPSWRVGCDRQAVLHQLEDHHGILARLR